MNCCRLCIPPHKFAASVAPLALDASDGRRYRPTGLSCLPITHSLTLRQDGRRQQTLVRRLDMRERRGNCWSIRYSRVGSVVFRWWNGERGNPCSMKRRRSRFPPSLRILIPFSPPFLHRLPASAFRHLFHNFSPLPLTSAVEASTPTPNTSLRPVHMDAPPRFRRWRSCYTLVGET
jgi:hypothetical protein